VMGGEWEEQEWAKEVVQAYWAQGIEDDRVHQHDMPRVRADVGWWYVVSYYEGDGKHERRIGCVRRVYVGEHGVNSVGFSTTPSSFGGLGGWGGGAAAAFFLGF
jgi:hypothetical protein